MEVLMEFVDMILIHWNPNSFWYFYWFNIGVIPKKSIFSWISWKFFIRGITWFFIFFIFFFSSIDYLQLSILLGLMAIAGAVIRKVLSQKCKELHMSTKEWVILIGGGSAYADYIIYTTFDRVFVYQTIFNFL